MHHHFARQPKRVEPRPDAPLSCRPATSRDRRLPTAFSCRSGPAPLAPPHRLRTGITDDSATGEPNTMVDHTDYWTLSISILPADCVWQICCVAVESQFLHGIKEGADIGYGLVGAAAGISIGRTKPRITAPPHSEPAVSAIPPMSRPHPPTPHRRTDRGSWRVRAGGGRQRRSRCVGSPVPRPPWGSRHPAGQRSRHNAERQCHPARNSRGAGGGPHHPRLACP